MKFGRQFQKDLHTYPAAWTETAVTYRQLKKIINRVRRELAAWGYDTATVGVLLANATAEYRLLGANAATHVFRPELSIRAAAALDAAAERARGWVRVPLTADGEFFDVIQDDVTKLDVLHQEQNKSMKADVAALGVAVAAAARPHRFSQSDLNRWRAILERYVEAQLFFSTREADNHAPRTSVEAVERLQWFQRQVEGLSLAFKLAASRTAFARFLALNAELLQTLKFQELNRTAIEKILKSQKIPLPASGYSADQSAEFDKRTCLGGGRALKSCLHSGRFLAENVAKDVCAELAIRVVACVPQSLDHQCPVCWDIFWTPIRLRCGHVFCRQCVVLMQKSHRGFCPLCRASSVLEADEGTCATLGLDAPLGAC